MKTETNLSVAELFRKLVDTRFQATQKMASLDILRFGHDNNVQALAIDLNMLPEAFTCGRSESPWETDPVWAPLTYRMARGRKSVSMAVTAFVMTLPEDKDISDLPQHIKHYARVVYYSRSKVGQRWTSTVVIPLAKPVPAADWPKAFDRINAWMGGIGSRASRNPQRTYPMAEYLPEDDKIYAYHYYGELLNLS